MDEYLDVELIDIETSDENLDTNLTVSMDEDVSAQETQTIAMQEVPEEIPEEKRPSGNLHIMIIVASLCAIIGVALGIWRGIKASSK